MDVVIAQFPNKTIEIAPLGAGILVAALKKEGYKTKQYDYNVELKNALLTEKNLEVIFKELLPHLLRMELSDKNCQSMVSLYNLLKGIDEKYSFAEVEYVKLLLQKRNYVDVFKDEYYTKVYESMLSILSLSNNLFEVIISCKSIQEKYSDFFVFTMAEQFCMDVITEKPLMLCFSIVQMQRKFSMWIIKSLREKFQYKGVIVVGGADITYYKEKYLECFSFLDYAVYQEGEYALVQLAEYLMGKREIENVSNLIYRKEGEIVIQNAEVPYAFDQLVPDFDDLKLEYYLTNALPMQISRGCSWGKCTYCKHFRTYGQKYYKANISNSIKVIKELMEKYKTDLFHFVDDDFPRALKNEFSRAVLEEGINIKWLTYSRLDSNITKEDLNLWYKAGLRVIEWGLESASQSVLNSVNKGIEIDNIINLLFEANNIGFLNKLFMFHNLPEENYEDLYESIQFLKKFVRYGIVRPFWEISTPLELLEGTILYEQAMEGKLFDKVLYSRGLLDSKAKYVHKMNYEIKKDIFNKEFEDIESHYKDMGVLNVNDEAIMFDVIIDELSKENILYAKVRG